MYSKPTIRPTFDIRTFNPNAELDNDATQAAYDTLNRMVLLIGDIPFSTLFQEDWDTLMPILSDRLNSAHAFELLRDRDSGADNLNLLSSKYAKVNFVSYFNGGLDQAAQDEITDNFIALRRHGIHLPFVTPCAQENEAIRKTLSDLLSISVAAARTYKDIFARYEDDFTEAAREVIYRGIQDGLIHTQITFYCCDGTSCIVTNRVKKCSGTCPNSFSDPCVTI